MYKVQRHRPEQHTKAGVMVPTRPGEGLWDWVMIYGGGSRIVGADTVPELVAVLTGDADYCTLDPQEQLVARIRVALGAQVVLQARLNHSAMMAGRWDECAPWEQTILNGPRHEQPRGWSEGLDGFPASWWSAPCPLVAVSTGYIEEPRMLPVGPDGAVLMLDPLTDEDLLDSLDDARVIEVYGRIT